MKTIEEINTKIKSGKAVIVTAEEIVGEDPKRVEREIDVVTTGTLGMMCSTGAFINFGHADPPIKFGGGEVFLNDVPAYAGLAAVDAYIGATQFSRTNPEYGGGHVIEDLISGKKIYLRGSGHGSDCYPRRYIETEVTLEDVNQAYLVNPRNAYQKYNAATNSSDRPLFTYMGELLPNFGNVTFSGAGCLSPLYNDPDYETIGIGTRIFLGGGVGYIIGEGTQHDPQSRLGTLMVKGNLKQMNPKYLKGAYMKNYGCTVFVGVGIPIPIINEKVAKSVTVSDKDIITNILDYSVPKREKPVIKQTTYAELRSGTVNIKGKKVRTSSLSSFKKAREIANLLKKWVKEGKFLVTEPVERLPTKTTLKPMKQTRG